MNAGVAPRDSPAVELRAVSKRWGGLTALAPTTLEIPTASTTVLLGPSGCGKSTMLRLMIGLLWPDEGQVHLLGEPLTPSSAERLRRRVGYVIQEGGLFPHLSAQDNVTLLARWCGWEPARITPRVAELAELVRLPEPLLARRPTELSGGQRQRVALMRALMLDPPLLLLDEPLGALDPMVRAELQDELRAVIRTLRKAVVLVTHDLAEADHLGDRVALLRDGQIVQVGSLDALESAPTDAFVTRFLSAQRSLWGAR